MDYVDDIIDEIELGGNTNGVWIITNNSDKNNNDKRNDLVIIQQSQQMRMNAIKNSMITNIENETHYVKISDLCTFIPENTKLRPVNTEEMKKGKFKFYTGLTTIRCDEADHSSESIIVSMKVPKIYYTSKEFGCSKDTLVLQQKPDNFYKINLKYLYCYLKTNTNLLKNGYKSIDETKKFSLKRLDKEFLKNLEIPVLSENKQNKIIAEYDSLIQLKNNTDKKITEQKKKLFDMVKSSCDAHHM